MQHLKIIKIEMKKQYYLLSLALLLLACNHNSVDQTNAKGTAALDSSNMTAAAAAVPKKITTARTYQLSTFDQKTEFGNFADFQKTMQAFEEKGYFNTLDQKQRKSIAADVQKIIKDHFKVLASSIGDLFQNGQQDAALITYDIQKKRIAILLYDRKQHKIGQLYTDYKVVDGLADANCPFGHWGTVDYLIMQELSMDEENIKNNGETYLNYTGDAGIRITDLNTDDTFASADGCFAQRVDRANLKNSLALSISSAYANYLVFKFNKQHGDLDLYYGQAFAD